MKTGLEQLASILPILEELDDWTADSIQLALVVYAANECDNIVSLVAQPIRIALSGTHIHPPTTEVEPLSIYDKPLALKKIKKCLEWFGPPIPKEEAEYSREVDEEGNNVPYVSTYDFSIIVNMRPEQLKASLETMFYSVCGDNGLVEFYQIGDKSYVAIDFWDQLGDSLQSVVDEKISELKKIKWDFPLEFQLLDKE